MSISLNNIVRVAISGPPKGLAVVNTSALAMITHEAPIRSWGSKEFGLYVDAQKVTEDFGSGSVTSKLAETVFSQKATILKGGGHLLVIPRKQTAAASPATVSSLSGINFYELKATDYRMRFWDDGSSVKDVEIGELDLTDISSITKSLNSQFGTQGNDLVFTVSGEITNAFVTVKTQATGAAARISFASLPTSESGTDLLAALNLLDKDNDAEATGTDGPGLESVKDTILRTVGSIPYFATIYTQILPRADLIQTAATVQSLNLLQFVVSNTKEDLYEATATVTAGLFNKILQKGYTKTRTLYYNKSDEEALTFAAGYASILLSMNFSNPGSALTMNLKDFTGLEADTSIGDTEFNLARTSGVDILASIGIPKIFSNGANLYADQVYTRLALQVDLQIAGINFLSTTNTKIPQTEEGMVGLKGAYSSVLHSYVIAGVYAPGEWKSSTVFSPDGDDHRRNVAEWGYYVYSSPVAQQTPEMRAVRIAPVVQIAVKEAGALHSSNVVVEARP